MPKVVDPAQRRTAVVEAVLRIAERDGLEQATLRNIAAEAGLAIGSVRHYFADHAEVMSVAMKELIDRLTSRILMRVEAVDKPGADKRAVTQALLEEFLPLDDQRNTEVAAWLSFINAARTEEGLRPYARAMHEGTRHIVRRIILRVASSKQATETLDVDVETDRLAALLDGLSLEGVLYPDLPNPDAARAVLRRHLDSLLSGS